MAYINLHSKPSVSAACDIFSIPPTQRSCDHGYFNIYRPISNYENEDAPIEFVIPGNSEYIDLGHTKLRIRAKILKDGGESTKDGEGGAKVLAGPVNNLLHSLFSQVHIELNNTCITQSAGLYNYRAMIENLLNYGVDARETHLRTSLFRKDSGSMNHDETSNVGFKYRKDVMEKSSEIDLESHIHADIFNVNKLLLSNVPLMIKFYKSKPSFVLMTDTATDKNKYTIKITEASLLVRKIKVSSSIALAHEAALLKTNARYFITRVEVKNHTIPKDLMSTCVNNLFIGEIYFFFSLYKSDVN